MPSRIFHFLFLVALFVLPAMSSHAAGYEVTDVLINTQADDAVKARDQAIIQAQRKAFSVLVGKSEKDLEKVTDTQISRLVSGFSVRGERLTARSYTASFTIRFEPNRTQSFVQSQGFDLVTQELASMTGDSVLSASAQSVGATGEAAVPQNLAIVILPILDIGSSRTIWSDPNPWRDAWQKKDNSIKGMPVKVPLGDVTDIADIPDASLLTGGKADVPNFLVRYGAGTLYIAVAKNQGAALDPAGGMAVSLYRHDGTAIKFLQKIVLHPRPGYAFEDAVPAALNMIVMAENNKSDQAIQTAEEPDESTLAQIASQQEQKAILGTTTYEPAPMTVTVPYQNLPQWVSIQRRLRTVQGIKSILPIRVAPSSAEVQIITTETSANLSRNFAAAGFELQALPSGEVALIER